MKKYLETDESVKKLKSREELWEYLKFRKENDEWLNVFINEMAAVGIKNEPLFIPQSCSNLKICLSYHIRRKIQICYWRFVILLNRRGLAVYLKR